MPWIPSATHPHLWTNGVHTAVIRNFGGHYTATLYAPDRSALEAAQVDAQNLMDLVDAHDETIPADPDAPDHLAAVVALLDDLGAPKVRDTHALDPASRLAAYLDQTRARIRATAEDDAEEWAASVQRERGLVEAVAALGNLLGAREGR